MARPHFELGDAELEVLRALWDRGPSTVREVMNHLHERGRHVAYTTVLTFLTRLDQKGFVRSDRSDLAYVYKAVVSHESVTRSRLKTLVDQFFDGSAAPLVLQLMKTERFSPQELEQLQRLIDELDSKTKTQPDTRGKRTRR